MRSYMFQTFKMSETCRSALFVIIVFDKIVQLLVKLQIR